MKTMIMVLLSFTMLSCMTNQYTETDYLNRKSPRGPSTAWTAIVPGLPQVLQGEYIRGLLYIAPYLIAANLTEEKEDGTPSDLSMGIFIASIGVSALDAYLVGQQRMELFRHYQNTVILPEVPRNRFEMVYIGMPEADLIKAAPLYESVNRSNYSGTLKNQYVYRTGSGSVYIYTTDGFVDAWQDSRR